VRLSQRAGLVERTNGYLMLTADGRKHAAEAMAGNQITALGAAV
jgi:hypothetical protein